MNLIKKLANRGAGYTYNSTDKQNILMVNSFSIVLFSGTFLLILIRTAIFYLLSNSSIAIGTNFNLIIAAFLFLAPLGLNRFGFPRLARFYLCWLPSIIIIAIYITDGVKRPGIILTSQYDSLYLFLLGASAIPYLLLSVSNKKELVTGLSLPFLLILFSQEIMNLFGAGHAFKGLPGDGFELNRMRAMIAYLILNGCCFSMKMLVEKQAYKNEMLIGELKEKNKMIDQHAEKEIKESENKYRLLFEQAADAITVINEDKIFEQVNSSACEMFGYKKEEFLLLKLEDILDKDALKTNPLNFDLFKGYHTVRNERILRRKDGSIFPAEINVRMLPDGSYQSFIHDITNRKKAQQEIIEAEEKFRTLVEKSLVGVYIIKDGKYAYVNPEFAKIFGYSREELINSYPVEIVVYPEDRDKVNEYVRVRIEGEKDSIHYEVRGHKKNGEIMQMEVFGSKTQYEGKPAIIGTLMDVTENKLLQQEILNQKIQEQKKITRAVLNAEEKERNRIGQELHDNVNQILAGTKLFLGLAEKDETGNKGFIKSSLGLVDKAIDEMRSLSKGQVTPLKAIDLEEMIQSLIHNLNTISLVRTTFIYDVRNQAIEDGLKLNIYRIIQEQINNILKHADASHVIISIKECGEFLNILIEDDGNGFDPGQKRDGIGISNMINRIESFNGQLEIDSSPGNGFRLKIKVPCKTLQYST